MTARDIVMGAAGNSGDSKTYIEDVFSTYLYTGNGSTQTINNGIDLAGKGGMVWIKDRVTSGVDNVIYDTNRGALKGLIANYTVGQTTSPSGTDLKAFNSDGFSLGPDYNFGVNTDGKNIASWTFRKAPKFFDVVTYTGNGVAGRQISHSLGVAPGMIIVKVTSTSDNWCVYHRSLGASKYTYLNTAAGSVDSTAFWYGVEPTASNFTVSADYAVNYSGRTYVAYLFAHDTTTDGLIQCGSYTGNGSATAGTEVNLGWEPQYVLIKLTSASGENWQIYDVMRGMPVVSTDSANTHPLFANTSDSELNGYSISPTSTGFRCNTTHVSVNGLGKTYIYMAIRRGPMRTPTDGTKVFLPTARVTGTGTVTTGFPVDTLMSAYRSGGTGYYWGDRIRGGGKALVSANTNAETAGTAPTLFTSNTSYSPNPDWFYGGGGTTQTSEFAFRRAPGFFDVVCYTGNSGTPGTTKTHNLGVAPELIIVKRRDSVTNWIVYSSYTGNSKYLFLNTSNAAATSIDYWNNTSPTSSIFTLGGAGAVNSGTAPYVAYLFASCPGVSKVGSYTGNGSSQTINCGFSAGARFVLIKRTDSTGDWYVWDTARGIVAANDPHLSLNTTAAEVTTNDTIDPNSTGFIVNQVAATNVNVSGGSYIYLAIA